MPEAVGGNGYLSAYVVGLILGNTGSYGKKHLFGFFDGFTGLMQMGVFFLLGLLSFPSALVHWLDPHRLERAATRTAHAEPDG